MNYLQAEHLKNKRTFAKKLILLAPVVTVIMNILRLFGSSSIPIIGGISCSIPVS